LKFHDNTSHDQSTNLATITNWHNAQGDHELDASVHWNAYNGTAHGTEVLYVTQQSLASTVARAISGAGGFTLRHPEAGGAVYRGDLYFLNNTREKAILIETAFCDNTSDCEKYRAHFEAICTAIAESISGTSIGETPPPDERPPIEPPEAPTETVNYIEMRTAAQPGVQVLINGATIHGTFVAGQPVVDLTLIGHGDVSMMINGEMFHNRPPEPPALFKATGACSWFGGPEDTGVSPDEGLAFIYEYAAAPHLFLPQQPPGTTGLARRLNPDVYYVACRWDYSVTPKTMLARADLKARVRAGDREFLAWPADWGPNEATGRVADISLGLMTALGIDTDDTVEVIYPIEDVVV
jgi:hypothetical protein